MKAEIHAVAEMAKAGLVLSPRTYSTGTILYGAMGSFAAPIDSLDDARSHLRRLKAAGAISVKSYNQPRREQRQQVLAAARELGMHVVPEGGSLFLATVRPDAEELWLVAVLESPKKGDTGWSAAKNAVPITDSRPPEVAAPVRSSRPTAVSATSRTRIGTPWW